MHHNISITYIPNFTEVTLIDPSNSHNYLQKIETIKYSLYNEYRVSENLSLTNSLFYDAVQKKEYIDGVFLTKVKEKHFGVDIGMNYEWLCNFVNPSIGITIGYPSHLSTNASTSLIRDPVILTVGLNYNNNYNNKAQQWSLIQSLGFIANDKISLRLSIASAFSDNFRPQINSVLFSTNYSLDPENKQRISFNNVFRLKDGIMHLNLGLSYSF